MRRFLRFALRFAAVAGILAAALLAGAYLYLRQSLPQTKGEIRLAGPSAPIEILRGILTAVRRCHPASSASAP